VDGTYLKELDKLNKMELLILDDFGLQALDVQDRETLRDIIDDRHGKRSTIISSQIPVAAWYEIIGGEGTVADAILDRIVGYFGSICASHLSLLGPVITVQNVPYDQ